MRRLSLPFLAAAAAKYPTTTATKTPITIALHLNHSAISHTVIFQVVKDLLDGFGPLKVVHLDERLDAVVGGELKHVLVLGLGRDQAGMDVINLPEERVGAVIC